VGVCLEDVYFLEQDNCDDEDDHKEDPPYILVFLNKLAKIQKRRSSRGPTLKNRLPFWRWCRSLPAYLSVS